MSDKTQSKPLDEAPERNRPAKEQTPGDARPGGDGRAVPESDRPEKSPNPGHPV